MKKLLLVMALWVGVAGASLARTVEEQLLATLRSQGYEILEQGYTFLGRLRVVAQNGEIRREIVVNPGTGEILRDYAVMLPMIAEAPTTQESPGAANPVRGGGTTGIASSGGVASADDPASATDPDAGVTGFDTMMSQGAGGMGGNGSEWILVDPILPFTPGEP